MAKKTAKTKPKAEEKEVSVPSFTDRVLAEIQKDYGGGSIIDANQALSERQVIIPWTPTLDLITGGGIIEGSWVGITGNEKMGKTTAALTFAASAQQPEYGSRPVYYFKVEGRLSLRHLADIEGLDRSKLFIVQSTPADEAKGIPARILSAQDHLNIALHVLRTVPNVVIIFDSISRLCSEDTLTTSMDDTAGVAADARLFSRFINIASNLVPLNKAIFIGITQQISTIKKMGPQSAERAAKAWKYQCDYQLRPIIKADWPSGKSSAGFTITWVCNTSPLGNPGLKADGYLRFGLGFDRLMELIMMAIKAGLIKQAGAWYSLTFLDRDEYKHLFSGEVPRFQGGDKLYAGIKDRPEWRDALAGEVRSLYSQIAGL